MRFDRLLGLGVLSFTVAAGAATAPTFTHPLRITNKYLPMGSLRQDVLEARDGKRVERVVRTLLPETRTFRLNGKDIQALTVEDRETVNGKLTEVTKDYFAQSDDGTVYYLGEDVDEYRNGKVVGHGGAWLLGKQTKTPGVLMPGKPKIGARFRSEDVPNGPREDDEIVSVSESITVRGTTYRNCVKTREKTSDGVEYKWYSPGVGVVQEGEGKGALKLVSHTTR